MSLSCYRKIKVGDIVNIAIGETGDYVEGNSMTHLAGYEVVNFIGGGLKFPTWRTRCVYTTPFDQIGDELNLSQDHIDYIISIKKKL